MRAEILGLLEIMRNFPSKMLRVAEISASNLPSNSANRLRQLQIRGAIDQMRVFVAGNTFFAPALSFQAWNMGVNWLVIAWTAAILCFSWWLFVRWYQSYETDGSEEDMKWFVRETCLNAGLWSLGMFLFYPFVSGNEKTILTVVITGSLALGTVGFSQAPRAAFWYLGILTTTLTLVPFVCGLYWNTPSDLMIAGLALVAGVAIFNAVLERARAQMKAFSNHESLLHKSEVVDLLLKDYEEQSVDWVWRTDCKGNIVACPQQVLGLISGTKENNNAIGMIRSLTTHIDPQGVKDLERVTYAFETRNEFYDVTLPLFSKSLGTLRWINMRGRPQYEGNEFVGFRGIFADATKGVEAQKQVEFLAENDPLTGMRNRNYVQTYLEALDPQKDVSTVYLIDLDGFKQVNDSYGHIVGDKLLQHVATRLNNIVGNIGIVSRLGGDEFLIMISSSDNCDSQEQRPICADLLDGISKPYFIEQFDISVSASIGSANFPDDTGDGPNLLNRADLALYAAKKGGRNKCLAFVEEMQEDLQKRIIVTERLRKAVLKGEILPYYQPQYCAKTSNLIGFEALARWTDEELGTVGPDTFIPIAEETGLIHKMGEDLLHTACSSAMAWSSIDNSSLPTVSVNVSPVQVMRGDIVQTVKAVLEQTGLPPHRLEIEITEGVLIEDMTSSVEILAALSELGIKIALDDFGTGYSSLSYLRALPLDRIKIDKSFVADIHESEAQSIVQTVIDLGRRLDLEVVAEGVETSSNVNLLRKMQCSVLQGYYFSRPIPEEDVLRLINTKSKSAA